MNAAQETAIRQITEIAREHFDASVFIGMGEVTADEAAENSVNPDKFSDHEFVYHGGKAACIGLLEMGKIRIWQDGLNQMP